MFKRISILTLLFMLVAIASFAETATYTVWGATGPAAEVSYSENPVYQFTASTTASTNICNGLGGGPYSHVMIHYDQPFWLNGTTATPSLGFPMATDSSPMTIEVPSDITKVRWTAIASGTAANFWVIGITKW